MKTRHAVVFPVAVQLFLAACASSVRAQSLSAWTTGSGTASLTSGAVRIVVAAGQGQPISTVSAVAGPTLYQGYLAGGVLFTNLDHDADGLCDEVDPDNDSDGLADLDELYGNLFPLTTVTDVNNADSDGDGASDGSEVVMATNPLDAESLLRLTQFQLSQDGWVTLAWQAQGGVEYAVDWDSHLGDQWEGNPIPGTVQATGGTGPWRDTVTAKSFKIPSPTNAFFRVRVVP